MTHLVLFLALAGQSAAPSAEAIQHAKAGLEARQEGHLDDAIKEFTRVTELAPDLAAGFVNLGAAYLEKHDYARALPPLRRAIELDPNQAGAQQMLGFALLSQGFAAEAIPHLEIAHSQDALGIAQLATGQYAEAIVNLRAALEAHPQDPDLLYLLARASGLLSKQTFDELIARYPESARAHQAIADNYAALRRVPDAEKEFQEALRLRPETPGVHLALGQLYAAASDWMKAQKEFELEAKLQPGDAEAHYRYGFALLQNGKPQEAKAELERANQLHPEMPETLYALGKASAQLNDAPEAVKAWTRLLALEKTGPMAAQAHFGLAAIYRKQGKTTEAAQEMEEFNKLQTPSK